MERGQGEQQHRGPDDSLDGANKMVFEFLMRRPDVALKIIEKWCTTGDINPARDMEEAGVIPDLQMMTGVVAHEAMRYVLIDISLGIRREEPKNVEAHLVTLKENIIAEMDRMAVRGRATRAADMLRSLNPLQGRSKVRELLNLFFNIQSALSRHIRNNRANRRDENSRINAMYETFTKHLLEIYEAFIEHTGSFVGCEASSIGLSVCGCVCDAIADEGLPGYEDFQQRLDELLAPYSDGIEVDAA